MVNGPLETAKPKIRQNGSAAIRAVLDRRRPDRLVYAPNYWQWFSHHRDHGTLPTEISHCQTQLQMLQHLGLDVFSRNVYCDQKRCWFGGLADCQYLGVDVQQTETAIGNELLIDRVFHTDAGVLTERQRHIFDQSTLVQDKFTVNDYASELDAYGQLVHSRRWRFLLQRYEQQQQQVGNGGIVVAGELFSPLKMLHLDLGPDNTTFLLVDHPKRAADLMAAHELAQLDLVRQMAEQGVPAMLAMDNLDSMFHSPRYVDQYSANFYEQASRICHDLGSTFFIHACGQQRANLKFIASLGVDGLEGVASAPLGDVELEEAFAATGDRFILTGGISAAELDRLLSRDAVRVFVQQLFDRLRPFAHRFLFASACNTAFTTRWDQLIWFRDAWREFEEL
jgi:hypothetical protein